MGGINACSKLIIPLGSVTHLMNSTAPTTWPILSSEVRCQGPEHVLMDCIHSWNETAQCPDAIPAHITCYPRKWNPSLVGASEVIDCYLRSILT